MTPHAPRKDLVCEFCGKSFVRNEHLSRHRRIHTQEKPFVCDLCPQRFSRIDLQRRHYGIAHAAEEAEARPSKRPRVPVACDNCHRSKVKCTSLPPCSNCTTKGLTCTVSDFRAIPRQRPVAASTLNHVSEPVSQYQSEPSVHWEASASDTQSLAPSLAHSMTTSQVSEGLSPRHPPQMLAADNSQLNSNDNFDWLNMNDIFAAYNPIGMNVDNQMSYDSFFSLNDPSINDVIDWNFPMFPNDLLDSALQAPSIASDTLPDSNSPLATFHRFRHFSDLDTSRPPSPRAVSARPDFASRPIAGSKVIEEGVDNRAVLDNLISLFEINAAPWLDAISDRIVISSVTPPEWFTAVAAVGGLFSRSPGAMAISKWLYNNARYRVLAYTGTTPHSAMSVEDQAFVLETWILLSLFGYLAGDKRIYEITEVSHCKTMEFGKTYLQNLRPAEQKRKAAVLRTLLLLDCYRVVVAQRPAVLDPFQSEDPESTVAQMRGQTDSNPAIPAADDEHGNLEILYRLALITWNVVPSYSGQVNQLWSIDFMAIALDQWIQPRSQSVSESTMLLFHSIHLNMYMCIPTLQRRIATYCKRESRSVQLNATDMTDVFLSEERRVRAVWHSQQCITTATELKTSNTASMAKPNARSWIPLHYSYAVCTSVLALWFDARLDGDVMLSKERLQIGLGLFQSLPFEARITVICRKVLTDLTNLA